jgi:MerR family transcriptional regulator, light-induced transcriptional regulator
MKRLSLTSREAARLLGVSEASVKRWADAGHLRAERTAGGHRRFRPEDLARFRRETAGRGGPEAASLRPPAPGPTAGREAVEPYVGVLFEALVGGRADESAALFVNLRLRVRRVELLADELLSPAMRRVGEMWRTGELTVAQEHVATRTALVALQALRDASPAPDWNGLRALCCSTEEDFHELPVHVCALILEARGWEVLSLGANTPLYALAEAVAQRRPRLVCVASTVLGNPERAAREHVELRRAAARAGAALVLGGAGFAGEDTRRRFPADLHADSFTHLAEFADALAADALAADAT